MEDAFNNLYNFDKKYNNIIVGVDEAGRGPWAGPVVSAAVILDFNKIDLYREINDSKKLTEKKREKLFDLITNNCISYSIAEISHEIIDEINILNATLMSMENAILKIKEKFDLVIVDGIFKPKIENIRIECVKDGDAKSLSIAAASILAKVYRDRLMSYFDKVYPEYGFKNHKGYGTRDHIEALKNYGICPIHRKTYKPIKKLLKQVQKNGK
jgi:ribonuclease HII